MERGDLADVKDLKPGDRFYKQADKKANVLQMVAHAPKSTRYKTYKHWCCPVMYIGTDYEDRNTVAVDGSTKAVFLRSVPISANEPIKQNIVQ